MSTAFNLRKLAWPRISPLLDVAYEMDGPARAALLAKVSAEDAALGAEFARFLASLPSASNAGTSSASPAASVPFDALLAEALSAPDSAGHRPGQAMGAWTLVEKLGAGGMGEVWQIGRASCRERV